MAKAKAAKKAKPNPRNKKLYDDGMKVRKAVLGAGYVDNSLAGAANDDFMMSFQDVTTEYCWGYVWTRPGLPKKTRSMLNLAMLAALNRGPEHQTHDAHDNGPDARFHKSSFMSLAWFQSPIAAAERSPVGASGKPPAAHLCSANAARRLDHHCHQLRGDSRDVAFSRFAA